MPRMRMPAMVPTTVRISWKSEREQRGVGKVSTTRPPLTVCLPHRDVCSQGLLAVRTRGSHLWPLQGQVGWVAHLLQPSLLASKPRPSPPIPNYIFRTQSEGSALPDKKPHMQRRPPWQGLPGLWGDPDHNPGPHPHPEFCCLCLPTTPDLDDKLGEFKWSLMAELLNSFIESVREEPGGSLPPISFSSSAVQRCWTLGIRLWNGL